MLVTRNPFLTPMASSPGKAQSGQGGDGGGPEEMHDAVCWEYLRGFLKKCEMRRNASGQEGKRCSGQRGQHVHRRQEAQGPSGGGEESGRQGSVCEGHHVLGTMGPWGGVTKRSWSLAVSLG